MIELNSEQIIEYFKRSYTAVDGLWFVKLEEKYGFDAALEMDQEVWKAFPKIQARLLKSAGKLGNGMDALCKCLATKLNLEGFEFDTEKSDNKGSFQISISGCPWHNLMLKSGREKLSGEVGSLICNTEYSVWAAEFGGNIKFELKDQICKGSPGCVLQFSSI